MIVNFFRQKRYLLPMLAVLGAVTTAGVWLANFNGLQASTATTNTLSGTLPIRAAFVYGWYPQAWTQSGVFPYTNYHPSAGYYDETNLATIESQISALEYANVQAGILSWWGQGTQTDAKVSGFLAATQTVASKFKWSLYYEPEGQGDPTVTQIQQDLAYINSKYASDPGFLRINGQPVIFVYASGSDGCGMATRWKQADTSNDYIVLKVFSGYKTCLDQPNAWHQYSPAVATDSQSSQSYSISPGFWKKGESTPRLGRDLTRWQTNIASMIASNAPLQLITTFNEWGEGTNVESATEWATASGFGAYLDALHNDGSSPPPPPPTTVAAPTVALTSTPLISTISTSASFAWTTTNSPTSQTCTLDGGSAACSSPKSYGSLSVGSHQFTVVVANDGGSDTASFSWTITAPVVSDPVIAAAGDISCDTLTISSNYCHMAATSDLMVNSGLTNVLTLGDDQYEVGALSAFQAYFAPTWGRFKSIMHPAIGNHEYGTSGAAGYFGYFGTAGGPVGKAYYSYNIGAWHLIALNSNCSNVGGCGAGSPEEVWLKADLAAHPTACTLAYWHHPRFSSGQHGNDTAVGPLWTDLYNANADLVLNGHDHDYERFAPQSPSGAADAARGIREFVVGTGGKNHYAFGSTFKANSQAHNDSTFGVLRLTLHSTSYDFKFVPEAGKTFTDSGTGACH